MRSPADILSSLKQGDPQAVAFTAVAVFLLSVCWFSWTLLSPPDEDPLPLGTGAAAAQPPPEGTPLGERVDNLQNLAAAGPDANPFHLDPPRRNRPDRPHRKRPAPTPESGRPDREKPREDKGKTPRIQPKPTPTPRIETVTYVYRGLLKRPDGATVALVSRPKDDASRYVRVGDALEPVRVTAISTDVLEVRDDDDAAVFLPRGEPHTFELSP